MNKFVLKSYLFPIFARHKIKSHRFDQYYTLTQIPVKIADCKCRYSLINRTYLMEKITIILIALFGPIVQSAVPEFMTASQKV